MRRAKLPSAAKFASQAKLLSAAKGEYNFAALSSDLAESNYNTQPSSVRLCKQGFISILVAECLSTKAGLCGILQIRGDFMKIPFNDVPYTAIDADMYVMDSCDNEIEERGLQNEKVA